MRLHLYQSSEAHLFRCALVRILSIVGSAIYLLHLLLAEVKCARRRRRRSIMLSMTSYGDALQIQEPQSQTAAIDMLMLNHCAAQDTDLNGHQRLDSVSCTTFNILAPVYKRINSETCRESQFREDWKRRNEQILEMLLTRKSSIICLQELWLRNRELVDMYELNLESHGYEIYKLRRTHRHEDGLLTAIQRRHFSVLCSRELCLQGDRVAQILHVNSVIPFQRSNTKWNNQETLIVNTHLMFPHSSNLCLLRLRQVYRILEYLETYQVENNLPPMPIILCGDWNGTKRGRVYKFLRSQGFVSSYDTARRYTDNDADAHRWVSHRNHRGNICGVDFIWLLNPNNQRKPLKSSWNDAVFGIIKSKLNEAGFKDMDAFCFFKSGYENNGYVTLSEFHEALQHLDLTEKSYEGLSDTEVEDLFNVADADSNGLIDFEEFQMMLNTFSGNSPRLMYEDNKGTNETNLSFQMSDIINQSPTFGSPRCLSTSIEFNDTFGNETNDNECNVQETTFGFDVEQASLFPPEVERGTWPENYLLSDHATLTVVFTPVRLRCVNEYDY